LKVCIPRKKKQIHVVSFRVVVVSKKQHPPPTHTQKNEKAKKTRSSESDPVAAMERNLISLYYIISFPHTKLFRNVKAGKIDLICGGIGET
jgi:hypothetical protein